MAFATPAQIQDRVLVVGALIPGINTVSNGWPETEEPFTNAQLPALVVQMLPITPPANVSAEHFMLPLDFLLTVLADRFPDDVKIRERDNWTALAPFASAVPTTFKRRPRLENNDSGLAFTLTLPRMVSYGALPMDGALYPTIAFRMTVSIMQS